MRALIGLFAVVLCACPGTILGTGGGAGGGGGAAGSGGGGGGSAGSGGGGSAGGAGGSGGGFAANARLTGLGDGTAIDLGDFTCTSPGAADGSCSRVTDYSGLTYDSTHHQLLMFGGGHSTTMTDSIFAFDLNGTLTWKELYAPTPCAMMVSSNLDAAKGAWLAGTSGPYPRPLSIHSYDLLAWAPVQNEFVLMSRLFTGGYCNTVGNDVGGPIAHYSLGAGAWSFTSASAVSSTNIDASEFDPVSGKILLLGRSGLSLYDPAARIRTVFVDTYNGDKLKDSLGADADFNALGYANDLVHFPPTDTFYYFVRGAPVGVFALKLNRTNPKLSTLDALVTSGPTSDLEDPGYAYDAKNQLIGGAVKQSTFYAFDPATKAWSSAVIKGGAPGTLASLAIGYDPVNNVYVFRTDYSSGSKTWAFRWKN